MRQPVSPEETIFNVVRQLSNPQDRAAYLNDACGDNKALRERVERLLQAEHHANEFLANNPLGLEEVPLGRTGREGSVKASEGSGSILSRYKLLWRSRNHADKNACLGAESEQKYLPMTPPVAPVPGDVIEDYEIIEKIGGNMGFVFKARHRRLDKVVALKLLPAEWIADPARLARFQRELRVMGQLEHSNLVAATDARVVGVWHLVAMELIDGIDLQRLVETRGPLPVAEACELARQAALGLQYAHQHGLIHRDIKPSNLMLTRAGTIKVIDMGLALTKEEPTALLTHPGLVLGTMNYCAPEQFRDASRVDIRADIYSLGCTLYHLLSGISPYSHKTTLAEVVQAHLNEPFPSLTQTRPDVPVGLQTVLARMAAKSPGSRFATPGEVAEALAPFARGANLKHFLSHPASAIAVTALSAPVLAGEAAPVRKPRRPATSAEHRRKSRRKRMAAVVLVLLLAIAGAALFATKPWEGDPVVVLMDTTAAHGVYDKTNTPPGGSNAEEVKKALHGLLPPSSLRPEPISLEWKDEARIAAMRPWLVVIHRSSFFHPLNEVLEFDYPPFSDPARLKKWETLYRAMDDKLIAFIGFVGTVEPRTRFLVYSRGTDKNWLDPSFREKWVKDIEDRFPKLRGRIKTIEIPGLQDGKFRDPATRELIRNRVKEMLGLPEKRD